MNLIFFVINRVLQRKVILYMNLTANNLQKPFSRAIFIVVLALTWTSSVVSQGINSSLNEILPGHIMVKLASDAEYEQLNKSSVDRPFDKLFSRVETRAEIENLMRTFGLEEMSQILSNVAFNELRLEQLQKNRMGVDEMLLADDLIRTYQIRFSADVDPYFIASKISQLPGVIYAEPKLIMELAYVPNDPLFNSSGQNYFQYQKFTTAWEVTRSSRDIVIAIVDSGVDYTHPDLKDNLWRNDDPGRAKRVFPNIFDEVVNDTIGWNFWASGPASRPVQNSDPRGTAQSHGTHVAGIAAAVSDNDIGIASAGFNSTYMAIRAGGTDDQPRSIGFGYEGILYAAINEADIINCSFGSGSYSEFGKDVVDFATNLGSVIIAAAGNSNNDDMFYPAAYENVLSVGSVLNGTGEKSGFSNYGIFVDVVATGSGILSTVFNSEYSLNSGTSMSAPVVAGLAALVKHQFPDWSARRILGQIRGTANENVYAANGSYIDGMGKGVIDAFKAVKMPVPYIRVVDKQFVNESGEKLGLSEEGFMKLEIVNYGASTQGLTYQISNTNQTAQVTRASGTIGSLATFESTTVQIPVQLTETVLVGVMPTFKVLLRDTQVGYDDFRYVTYENLFVDTHDANRVHVSATSNGAIGFHRTIDATSGIGFVPYYESNGSLLEVGNVLYESGLMIETNIDEKVHLMSNVREKNVPSAIFRPSELFSIQELPNGDQTGYTMFTPDLNPGYPGLKIEMETYSFTDSELNRSLLVYYIIENVDPSQLALNDTYVGLFADWDIGNYSNNSINYRAADSLLIVSAPNSPYPFVTIGHLGGISSAFTINNAYSGEVDSLNFGIYYSAGSADNIGFTNQYKSWSLKAGLGNIRQDGTDVSMVSASGPFTIKYGEKIQIGFVYSFGETIEILTAQVQAARQRNVMNSTPNFNKPRVPVFIPDEIAIAGNYPNPFNSMTNILIDLERPGRAVVEIYDIMGRKVGTILETYLNNRRYEVPYDASSLSSGVYVVVLRTDQGIRTHKITLVK